MSLPHDYVERVYAGVLGKIIGVYLGRPFEGWPYDKIMAELGEVNYFVHEKRNLPLVVTDDDISGTFTFLRALPDYHYSRDLTPAQIGQTWLNYLIEQRTVLWWGGMGNSTEHTAYLRLKQGITAPASGSIKLNSKVVAEQIGAQIFIDGWAMVAAGDPAFAVELARRAGSVSHDGEAIYAAQVLAAMEAQAFVESDLNTLLDTGISFIPKDSVIYRMIQDIRGWHSADGDWRKTRERIVASYGYDKYGGNCHVVPNHALIILALLYGENDFQRSLMIVNTSGWDTDCNSGNVGCLLGIKNGLAGIDAGPDWRGPIADRIFLPTADGGRTVTDAAIEAYHVVNTGRALADLPPVMPKEGARFHFELPGSVQGFLPQDSIEARGVAVVENVVGHSSTGERSLAIHYQHVALSRPARVETATFTPPDAIHMQGYNLYASPTLYAGQTMRASIQADGENKTPVSVRLYIRYYDSKDQLATLFGSETVLAPGADHAFAWLVPNTDGAPIAAVGVEINAAQRTDGTIYLDYLTWAGTPEVVLTRPQAGGSLWQRAWVDAVDHFGSGHQDEPYRLIQDYGRGLIIQGTRDWTHYQVSGLITVHLADKAGIAAYVQGLRRFYALLLCNDGKVRLVKALDGDHVLAETHLSIEQDRPYTLGLQIVGTQLQAWVDGQLLFDVQDTDNPLSGGAVALICEVGRIICDAVTVRPVAH